MKGMEKLRGCRLGVVVGLTSVLLFVCSSCVWDKRLPFQGNELDPALLGFWWEELTPYDTVGCRLVHAQSLVQYRRNGDYYYEVYWYCPPDGNGEVVEYGKQVVFTKGGLKYKIVRGDHGLSHWLATVPYAVNGDTLLMGERGVGSNATRFVRVRDTSKVDWVVRRNMKLHP